MTGKLTNLHVILIIIEIWIHPFARSQATATQIGYSALDDQVVIRLIVQARAEALSELYDRYSRLVFSLALSSVGDPAFSYKVSPLRKSLPGMETGGTCGGYDNNHTQKGD
jgi:hypothetical protein